MILFFLIGTLALALICYQISASNEKLRRSNLQLNEQMMKESNIRVQVEMVNEILKAEKDHLKTKVHRLETAEDIMKTAVKPEVKDYCRAIDHRRNLLEACKYSLELIDAVQKNFEEAVNMAVSFGAMRPKRDMPKPPVESIKETIAKVEGDQS